MSSPRKNAMDELAGRFSRIRHTGQLGESFTRISSAVRALEDLNNSRDVTLPLEHHINKVGRSAQALAAKLDGLKEDAISRHTRESGRLSSLAVERLDLRPNRFEVEIRQMMMALPTTADRIAWLQDAAKDPSNGPLLAAVIQAPPALTGVSADVIKGIERSFIEQHAPDIIEMQRDLDDALGLVSASHRTATQMTQEFQNPSELNRIAQAQAQANNAAVAMQEALA